MDEVMREKLQGAVEEYERIAHAMSTQEVASDPKAYRDFAKRHAELADIVQAFRRFEQAEQGFAEADGILRDGADGEMKALAEEERAAHTAAMEAMSEELRFLLVPKDPLDDKNTIVEIRAGTGGEEAALFAADLFRMYSRYAETKRWSIEVLGANETELGGYREISFQICGDKVYSHLKWEGGGHRVQRVPDTETQGRIHTSAVTVAVLPEAEEVDIEVDPGDLQVDVYRSSGAGGQHVNTTDSAVRITHKPSGVVVTCQDERSQIKNRAKAMTVLRARLLAKKQDDEAAARSEFRKLQVGSGDRSERIRTYNFPQNRLTDHRINLTLYNLEQVMEGNLGEVIEALSTADRAERLANAS